MNKKFFACIAAVFSLGLAFSQITVDPQDDFYMYAQGWELKGYVKSLPQIRPYPLNVVKSILTSVMEKGTKKDIDIATLYWEKITGKNCYVELLAGIRQEMNNDTYKDEETGKKENETSTTRQYNGGPSIAGDVEINPMASFGFRFGIYAVNEDDVDVLPFFVRSEHDTVSDSTEVGPFRMNIDMNSNASIGKEHLYFQAGINRSGFGPFLKDDLALSDNAFHSPNMTFFYGTENWSYSHIMQSIGTSYNNADDLTGESGVGKYLALHSFRYRFNSLFTLSYYESTIIGNRFDFAYLLPAPFMAVQGIGDSKDNSQMGLLFELTPVQGLKWSTNFFADDISLNDYCKLNFDTKSRVGIETGVQYAPPKSSLDMMTVNYTIVAPYTYAHWSYDSDGMSFTDKSYNYFNYMNHGIAIGASIPPNSDRIGFSARFSPVKGLHMTLKTNFMRHANAYESLSDEEADYIFRTNYYSRKNGYVYVDKDSGRPFEEDDNVHVPAGFDKSKLLHLKTDKGDIYCTDSSAFSQQKLIGDDNHVDTAWDHLNLMNQDHTMTILQAGLELAYETPKMSIGTVTFNFGWTWEYITNNGVQNPIYSAKNYASGIDSHEKAYEQWEKQLHDSFNNYLSFSVKLAF